jgi:glycine/D-amino acid oxidase-like deaminating enzyme
MADPTIAYATSQFWNETARHRTATRRFEPDARYDVAIVGGGYTGLWTAYHLLKQNPSLRIAVLERDEVGFGASGRNAGFLTARIGHSLRQMVHEYGAERTQHAHNAAVGAVRGLADTVNAEGIDCDLHYDGLFNVATNPSQERKIMGELKAAEQLGTASVELLDADKIQALIHSPLLQLALLEKDGAVLHPAKLVRGLADVVERLGAHIFERCGSASLTDTGTGVEVTTDAGVVRADQGVIATNAWAGKDPLFKRWVIPMYPYQMVTEPLTDDAWASIGWDGEWGFYDGRIHLIDCRKTPDGRLLFGGRDTRIPFNSGISPRYDRDPKIFAGMEEAFREYFPQLAQTRFTHGWSGPIAFTLDGLPKFGSSSPRVHFGFGYCGHGVALSYLGGQILRDLIRGDKTDNTSLLFVNKHGGRYPAEPLRFIGAYLTRKSTVWYDEAAQKGKDVSEQPWLLKTATRIFAR